MFENSLRLFFVDRFTNDKSIMDTAQQQARKRPSLVLTLPPRPLIPREPPPPPSPSVVLRRSDKTGWLFLGNQNDAINPAFLNQNKITRFIHVCRECRCIFEAGDQNHLRIPIDDSHEESINEHFETAILFLAKARADDANVLVHCYAGISRSPTIVLAYMMNNGALFNDAYQLLKNRRACVDPNLHFVGSLLLYEKQLYHE